MAKKNSEISPADRIVQIENEKLALDAELTRLLDSIEVGQVFIIANIPHRVCKGRGENGRKYLRRMVSDEVMSLLRGGVPANDVA
jgi:hypothetical protein